MSTEKWVTVVEGHETLYANVPVENELCRMYR